MSDYFLEEIDALDLLDDLFEEEEEEDGLSDVGDDNDLFSLILTRRWSALLSLITIDKCMQSDSGSGKLPLHLALEEKAPLEVLSRLLEVYPDAAKAKQDASQKLPLHLATSIAETPLEFVQALLTVWPQGAMEKNNDGDLPLELAVQSRAPFGVISALIEAYPDVVSQENRFAEKIVDVEFPLHHACRFAAPVEYILDLLHSHPELAMAKDAQDRTPLHLAAANKETSLQVIEALLSAFNDGARQVDKNGNLPLEEALETRGTLVPVLSRLLKAYPAAAKVKSQFGRKTPLHLSVEWGAPVEFIMELIEEYPEGAREMNAQQLLPLHVALQKGALTNVLNCLFAAFPEAAGIPSVKDGQFPLHMAAFHRAPVDFVKDLLVAYPQAAQEPNKNGLLPLHIALRRKAPLDLLESLLQAHPDAAMVNSENNAKALHDAAYFQSPLEFIIELLKTFPEAARLKNKFGHVPLHIALENESANDVLFVLLMADLPFSLNSQNGAPTLCDHADSWTHSMDEPNLDVDRTKFLVKSVFEARPSLAHLLAHFKDSKGREAISICHADVRASMNTYLFFLGRYDLQQGPPIHKSATSIVCYAKDYLQNPPLRVALKFMNQKEEFEREVTSRTSSTLDGAFVLEVLSNYDGDTLGQTYDQELLRLGLREYFYCLSLPAADRSLKEIIDKERIAGGRNNEAVKSIASQTARAIEHLHSKCRIHGDIKPLNVVRVGEHIKLVDLDASALINIEHAASKFSSAYLPPGLIAEDGSIKQGQVLAHVSFDMWSYGCVLFQLCAGESLWLANDEDNITDLDDLRLLQEWSSETKARKLGKIKDKITRNLVSQLLNKEASKRPTSMAHVLAHPFFTGRIAGRLLGEEAEFDVFLSYRVDSDSQHVEHLYNALVSKGVKVWWDKVCLKNGVSWEAGFCAGLVNSRCFVPLMSKKAIKKRFEALLPDSSCDNVLLEYRLAIELFDRGLLDRVFPVMIGDHDIATNTYGNYFRQGCHPSASPVIVVRAVEAKLAEHLEGLGQGMTMREGMSVKGILDAICVQQGGFVEGDANALDRQAETIASMVRDFHATLGGGGSGGTLAEQLQEAIKAKEKAIAQAATAEERIADLMAQLSLSP